MIALDLVRRIEAELASTGIVDARLEAEVLVRQATGLSRVQLYAREPAPAGACEALLPLVARRLRSEPLAYITGVREFMGHSFRVTPAVLIPRPETELLVELAIRKAHDGELLVDVGTGSGCIAVSVALARPKVSVVAVDRSVAALEVARSNAAALAAPVTFACSNLATALAEADFILANLPYIPAGFIEALQPEVRSEPRLALDGGGDGLDLVRSLLDDCARRLYPRLLALEVMAGQAEDVAKLAAATGATVDIVPDLAGIDRVVTASWR